jgi:hypothetical protein
MILAGHSDICDGVRPFKLKGRAIGGGDHDLLTRINVLQQAIVDEARCGGMKSFARMKEALKASKKLSAELEGSYFEKYEAGLSTLKDYLAVAILAEEDEQTVETLGGIFQHLSQALADASLEVKQRTVESLPAEFGVRLAPSVDIQTMLVEVDPPEKRKRPWDSPGSAENSNAKRNKNTESNDVVSNVNHEGLDVMEGEGEHRNLADDESRELTGPISNSIPTPTPAPAPRASRPTVRMLWGLTDSQDTPPGGKKHSRDFFDIAEGSKTKRSKASGHNDVAPNVNHQGSDGVEGEGEDRNPTDNDVDDEPNELTGPISIPASAPAPTPRVSRTAVHVYHHV